MGFLTIQTEGGPLSFVGRLHSDRPRPCLLAVTGAFPPKKQMHELVTLFTGVNVLVLHLPGMGGAFWADDPHLPALTLGLDQAIQRLVGDVPLVVCGVSAGNLLALGLESPRICRRVALEPFFQTGNLWPFIANARARLELNVGFDPMHRLVWNFFGVGPDRVENRDYRYLVERIKAPTDVVLGERPLAPEREIQGWPSLTSAEDRALLAANPLVTLHVGPEGSGHEYGVVAPGSDLVGKLLHQALRDAWELLA